MKILKNLRNLSTIIAGISLTVLVTLSFLGVIMRYVFNSPIPFLQEVQLFCAVWLIFFGGSEAVRSGSIVSIDFIVDQLPRKIHISLDIIIYILTIAVLLFLSFWGFKQLHFLAVTERLSYILEIPFWIIYLSFPLGCLLMSVEYLIKVLDFFNFKNNTISEQDLLTT